MNFIRYDIQRNFLKNTNIKIEHELNEKLELIIYVLTLKVI